MTHKQKETIKKLREEIAKLKGFKVIIKEKVIEKDKRHIETKKERRARVDKSLKELKKKGILNYNKEDENETKN